jgi:4-diphosphocytidyl-2-C-methyl-D-erythritol kinase
VAIHLEKRIPIGAGLGGGSSNAAATLRGLNRLYQLDLSQEQLLALGVQLGSDVAFFLSGGTAFAGGRGERIQPLPDISPAWVVLVNPGIHISSGWAYKKLNLKLTNFQGLISVLPEFDGGHITGLKDVIAENTLELSAIHAYPIIQEIKDGLQRYGAEWVMMSGSGSTVFGIFEQQAVAEQARQRMEQPGWMAVLTRTKQRTVVK